MATIPFSGQLGTTSPTDTYATHDSNLGRGGYHSVADIAARDAIPQDRRSPGMLVFVKDSDGVGTNATFQLGEDISQNAWSVFSSGAEVVVPEVPVEFLVLAASTDAIPTSTKDKASVLFPA